jgi:hypothetical protein
MSATVWYALVKPELPDDISSIVVFQLGVGHPKPPAQCPHARDQRAGSAADTHHTCVPRCCASNAASSASRVFRTRLARAAPHPWTRAVKLGQQPVPATQRQALIPLPDRRRGRHRRFGPRLTLTEIHVLDA